MSNITCYNEEMRSIILVAHNIRSTHNVGSLLRTCDGFGIERVIFSGYTPYPQLTKDTRLPHIYQKLSTSIAKTALGAEKTVPFSHEDDIESLLLQLKNEGYRIVGLEQDDSSMALTDYRPSDKVALLIGEEVHGVNPELLSLCDDIAEIPMFGSKESFNVSVATGIALYHLRVVK